MNCVWKVYKGRIATECCSIIKKGEIVLDDIKQCPMCGEDIHPMRFVKAIPSRLVFEPISLDEIA